MNLKEIFKRLSQRPIAVNPIYIELMSDVAAGYLLSQLIYWSTKMDGEEFWKKDDDIMHETKLTVNQLRSCKERLKAMPFCKIKAKGVPPRTFYKIDIDILCLILNDNSNFVNFTKWNSLSAKNRNSEFHKNELVELTNSIYSTDTTTDTTSDIKLNDFKKFLEKNSLIDLILDDQRIDMTDSSFLNFSKKFSLLLPRDLILVDDVLEFWRENIVYFSKNKRYKDFGRFILNAAKRSAMAFNSLEKEMLEIFTSFYKETNGVIRKESKYDLQNINQIIEFAQMNGATDSCLFFRQLLNGLDDFWKTKDLGSIAKNITQISSEVKKEKTVKVSKFEQQRQQNERDMFEIIFKKKYHEATDEEKAKYVQMRKSA